MFMNRLCKCVRSAEYLKRKNNMLVINVNRNNTLEFQYHQHCQGHAHIFVYSCLNSLHSDSAFSLFQIFISM